MNPVASFPEEDWDRLMDLMAKLSASTTPLSL